MRHRFIPYAWLRRQSYSPSHSHSHSHFYSHSPLFISSSASDALLSPFELTLQWLCLFPLNPGLARLSAVDLSSHCAYPTIPLRKGEYADKSATLPTTYLRSSTNVYNFTDRSSHLFPLLSMLRSTQRIAHYLNQIRPIRIPVRKMSNSLYTDETPAVVKEAKVIEHSSSTHMKSDGRHSRGFI